MKIQLDAARNLSGDAAPPTLRGVLAQPVRNGKTSPSAAGPCPLEGSCESFAVQHSSFQTNRFRDVEGAVHPLVEIHTLFPQLRSYCIPKGYGIANGHITL